MQARYLLRHSPAMMCRTRPDRLATTGPARSARCVAHAPGQHAVRPRRLCPAAPPPAVPDRGRPASAGWRPPSDGRMAPAVLVLTLLSSQCSVAFARVALARRNGLSCAGTEGLEPSCGMAGLESAAVASVPRPHV